MSLRTDDDLHDGNDPDAPSGLDRVLRAVSFASLALLVFVGGALVAIAGVFPAPMLKDAYNGGKALCAKRTQYRDITLTDLWQPARTPERGVLVHDPDRAQPGYSL